jgi:signal transduction histidine kinase
LAGNEREDIRDSAAEIGRSLDLAMQNLRRLIRDLRPVILDALGLKESIEELVSRWNGHCPWTRCRFTMTGCMEDLSETLGITIYRVVQEALTNVMRHADASEVEISIRRASVVGGAGEAVDLVISDDGQGIPPDFTHEGMGLVGMRERVLAAGGTCEVSSDPGCGVKIRAHLPVMPMDGDGAGRTETD